MNAPTTAHLRRLGWLALAIALLVMLWTSFTPEVTADGPVTPTPPISIKNELHVTHSNVRPGSFVVLPSSPSSKNHEGDAGTATALDDIKAAASSVITCGASGDLAWTTTSDTFQVVRQCTLLVPQDGWVFISANGSVALQDSKFEAQFGIGIDDSIFGEADTDRWVNVYDDSGNGTDKSVALSVLKPVTSGSHTFYFLGQRYWWEGTVLLRDPTLTVIYIPSASAAALPCGASGDWTTTITDTFQVIRECTLSVPQDGWAFISANSSVARQDGEFEAQFRIGIDDSTGGEADTDRWVNVYDDGVEGDGTDKSVALSVLKGVTSGSHTFYFLGRRDSGAGTALLYDPTLTVIYLPSASAAAIPCGASGDLAWTTTITDTFQVIRQCTFSVPQDGWAFISADSSVARQDGEFEAQFRIGIDDTGGEADTDRWINVYDDSGNGTDESVALSVLKGVTSGSHTFYFLGRRDSGAGTVLLRDPTLTVLVPSESKVFLPIILKQ
jgi:hypothetical protein